MPLPELVPVPFVLPAAANAAVAVDLAGGLVVGIQMPHAMTGTTLTLTGSGLSTAASPAYAAIKDSTGATISALTFAADVMIALDPATFAGVRSLTITSNGTEASARTGYVMVRN